MINSFKWKKQQILRNFSLRDIVEFGKNVTVFMNSQKSNIIEFVSQKLSNNDKLYLVIILVPLIQRYKLKNIVLRKMEDILDLAKILKENEPIGEIWVCTNNMNYKSCLSGRFSIDTLNGMEKQLVEIVIDDAPRLVEKVQLFGNSDCLIYMRNHWGIRYRKVLKQKCRGDVIEYSKVLLSQIERRRENIEEFYMYLQELGIISMSLDFRFIDGMLEFIDWDTENDNRVINSIFK